MFFMTGGLIRFVTAAALFHGFAASLGGFLDGFRCGNGCAGCQQDGKGRPNDKRFHDLTP
jgi:hypothetical protein